MSREIDLWRTVLGDATLMERSARVDSSDVSAITSLRRDYSAQAVSVALSMIEARRKAQRKFGERGRSLIADVAGVEQASGAAVAAYKARRFADLLGGGATIADLCCGIGGDAMALADAGLDVIAVDRDPLRAWMARQNGGPRMQAVCSDVATLGVAGMPIHLDPARRVEKSGRRVWRMEDMQPGPQVVGPFIEHSGCAAIKLSPGVDLEALPWAGELEFISEHGRLVQAVLWCGRCAQTSRRATLIDARGTHTLHGDPTWSGFHPLQHYLYTFDAAVERAELIGHLSAQVDAPVVHPKLGLLTSENIIDSPWLKGFEFIEQLPWRPKRVKQWLAANDAGLVEVKTRGKACDPDKEQLRLRGKGDTPYVVFVLRFDTKVQALITRRLSPAD
ncbi:MAG: THUMP-like domain-containing protein [Phycisphaeraceae bacterium]